MEPPAPSFLERNEFLIRRLHSLTGLVPVGAYVVVHLFTNATVIIGPEVYQGNVDKIHSLGPLLPFVEWGFIFLPILFHTIIGFVIIGGGLPNQTEYPLPKNIRYTLQRATGIVAFFFILFHVLHMHGYGSPLKVISPKLFSQFDPHNATNSTGAALQAALWVQIFYAVGILASVYHLANGLWTMGITWGIWTTPAAQRRADYICSGFGLVVAAVGLAAQFAFMRVDVSSELAPDHLEQVVPPVQTSAALEPGDPEN